MTDPAVNPAAARTTVRWRDLAVSTALLALALAAIAGLVLWSGLAPETISTRLAQAPAWLLASLCAISAAQAFLSGWKWRIVLRETGTPEHELPPMGFCVGVTGLGIVLSNVMTSILATIAVRSFAARRMHCLPALRGALTTTYEQIYDAAVVAMFAIATALAWSVGGGPGTWFALVGLGTAGIAGSILSIGAMRDSIARLSLSGSLATLAKRVTGWANAGLFAAPLVTTMLAISLLRYILLGLRAVIVVAGLGYALDASLAFQAYSLVQSTQLAAITPGNLGIQEWGWAAVLAAQGLTSQTATDFALTLRILTFVTSACVCITLALALMRGPKPERALA